MHSQFLLRLARTKTSILPEILQGNGGSFYTHHSLVKRFQSVLLPVKDKFQVTGVVCSPTIQKDVYDAIKEGGRTSWVKIATQMSEVGIKLSCNRK